MLVTTRQVCLPDLDDDEGLECKEEREERKLRNVLVLNDASFRRHVAAVEGDLVERYEHRLRKSVLRVC